MNMTILLTEALKQAEASASDFQIDQVAFLIGSFPQDHWLRQGVSRVLAADLPRICALLPEMEPCKLEAQALLRVSDDMNREDIVGRVADLIRRAVRP